MYPGPWSDSDQHIRVTTTGEGGGGAERAKVRLTNVVALGNAVIYHPRVLTVREHVRARIG